MTGANNKWRRRLWLVLVLVLGFTLVLWAYWWQSPARRVPALLNETVKLESRDKPSYLRRKLFPQPDWARIMDEIVAIGPRGIPALTEAMRDHDVRIRRNAACVLVDLGDPGTIPALISALKDEDTNVRYIAATGLGRLGGRRAVQAFVEMLRNEDEDGTVEKWVGTGIPSATRGSESGYWVSIPLRAVAADELGKIGDDAAVEALALATRNTNNQISATSFEALGRIGSNRALEILLSDLRDSDPAIRQKAAVALGLTHRKEAFGPLISALNEGNFHAVGGLGRLGDPRAVKPLLALLTHENACVRMWAAEALGELGDPVAIEPLKGLIADDHEGVRGAAMEAIDKLGS